MRRKFMKTAALALAAALMVGACAKKTEQNTFTGDTSEEPDYQVSLNPIMPSAYRDVQGLRSHCLLESGQKRRHAGGRGSQSGAGLLRK